MENALSVEMRGRVHAEELCHKCDTKPVVAAKTDFIDNSLLLILWNLLKTEEGPKTPAYRLARYFSISYRRFHTCLTVVLKLSELSATYAMTTTTRRWLTVARKIHDHAVAGTLHQYLLAERLADLNGEKYVRPN